MSLDNITDAAGTQWGCSSDLLIAGSVVQMDPQVAPEARAVLRAAVVAAAEAASTRRRRALAVLAAQARFGF